MLPVRSVSPLHASLLLASLLALPVSRAEEPATSTTPAPQLTEFAPGVISTERSEGVTFSPDGNTVYFCRGIGREDALHGGLLVSHRNGEEWSAPEEIPFPGEFSDFDFFVTPDGSRLLFSSNRPESGTERAKEPNIWFAEKCGAGWGAPQSLVALTGPGGFGVRPTSAANGNLYFSGNVAGVPTLGQGDVFVCKKLADGRYGAAENLGPAVNSPDQEYDPFVAPDESFLLFGSGRPGGPGRANFYISERRDGVWLPARKLAEPINSAEAEYSICLLVSPDGQWLYLTSKRNGKTATYRVPASALGLAPR